jgi:hypothetical protein
VAYEELANPSAKGGQTDGMLISAASPGNWSTNKMKQNLSFEASIWLGIKEIPSILWNPNAHYCVRKSPPLVTILSQLIQYVPSNSVPY